MCFPYAGGGASVFRRWAERAPSDVQICPAELPGRESRYNDPIPEDAAGIVQAVAPAMEPFLDAPYVLFGHSLGAFLAYELARELRRRNLPMPVRFFASACRAPHLPSRNEKIHQLGDKDFLARVKRISGNGAVEDHVDEMLELLLPIMRADFRIAETYQYSDEPAFSFPITAMGGLQDKLVAAGDLVAWRTHTSGAFKLRMLAGGHLFLRASPEQAIRIVLEELASAS
jgi:surfactin synthase thioesterase subunit